MPKKKKKSLLLFLCLFLIFFPFYTKAQTEENFDPNYIISDSEILDYNSMNLVEIEEFLRRKKSYLLEYTCKNPDEETMTGAEIIYDRSQANRINPEFIITLLQKEQSLIEDSSPSQKQLDWATGYGCPDGGSCNPRWKGLWKQINSASLQFYDYIKNSHLYNFKKGETYEFSNPYSSTKKETTTVTPANKATAALYNYTPHVYNGNYNFYKIWHRYFTKTYPNGSLLQAQGEPGIWFIQNGKKRPISSQSVLKSRFDKNKVIEVNKSDLDNYPKGATIKFPNYSLVRSPKGSIYLLVDNKKRGFTSNEAFRKIGFNPQEIVNGSWEDIKSYKEGKPITTTSTYPTGALLQNNQTGGIYWVYEGKKAPLLDSVFLKTKFEKKRIISVSPEELADYSKKEPIKFENGELLKSPNSPAVYLIADNQKRAFVSGKMFEEMGYKWENIITVPERILNLYPEGEKISEKQI